MGPGISPLEIKIMLESNPLKSTMLVGGLAVNVSATELLAKETSLEAYCCLPKSARAYLFPQSARICYFCGGPISADPICPQPTTACPAQPLNVGLYH